MPKGGARPGAGNKKGNKHKATLDKLMAREYVRQSVIADLAPLVDAQKANAQGLRYLVIRDKKTGKFVRVTEAMARVKLGKTEEIIEIWEKEPSVAAFTDLLNRALDKPQEQVQEFKITGDDEQIRRLHAGRARAKAAREATS